MNCVSIMRFYLHTCGQIRKPQLPIDLVSVFDSLIATVYFLLKMESETENTVPSAKRKGNGNQQATPR